MIALRNADAPRSGAKRTSAKAAALVVTSTGDEGDLVPGDGRCRTTTDGCTLRAAIEEANADPSFTRVRFEVRTRRGEAMKPAEIRPRTPLPDVAWPIHLDGPSQPGARPNTAPSPEPFNGALGVVLDGSALPREGKSNGLVLQQGATGSTLDGLVINSFPGIGIKLSSAADIRIFGCYIGTDASGLQPRGNHGSGIAASDHPLAGKPGVFVGGSQPRQRNIISGNDDNGAYPRSRWTLAGNYVGLGADGFANVANGRALGSGAFSIDDATHVVVGGDSWVDANVFAWNRSYGIAPFNADHLTISHNLIGVASDGKTPAGNVSAGIMMDRSDSASITANVVMNNRFAGILVSRSRRATIGGTDAGQGNVVSANVPQNIAIWSREPGGSGVRVSGNLIGTRRDGTVDPALRTDVGVSITGPVDGTTIGGTAQGEANVIAGNRVAGVAIMRLQVRGRPETFEPTRTAVLRNRFDANGIDTSRETVGGAIDYLDGLDTSQPMDYLPDVYSCTVGQDASRRCAGRPGDLVMLSSARVVAGSSGGITIQAKRQAEASQPGTFRIEVYEVGRLTSSSLRYLGTAMVDFGTAGTANVRLRTVDARVGSMITASMTPIDPSSPSGFGDTSEFVPPVIIDD